MAPPVYLVDFAVFNPSPDLRVDFAWHRENSMKCWSVSITGMGWCRGAQGGRRAARHGRSAPRPFVCSYWSAGCYLKNKTVRRWPRAPSVVVAAAAAAAAGRLLGEVLTEGTRARAGFGPGQRSRGSRPATQTADGSPSSPLRRHAPPSPQAYGATEEKIKFCDRILQGSGIADNRAALPHWMRPDCTDVPKIDIAHANREARMVQGSCVADVLRKTGARQG
jgi:hypothetical protein